MHQQLNLHVLANVAVVQLKKSIMNHKSDRNAVTVTVDHPVYYHQTFLNEGNLAASTGLKLLLKNAQFKI